MGRPVTHWQILAKQPEKLADFYCKLFDWNVSSDNALGYRELKTGSERGISGGLWPSPPEGDSRVQLFVEVEDVAGSVEKAKVLGAQVVIPPQKLPEGDEMAILLDPEGLSLGIWKSR